MKNIKISTKLIIYFLAVGILTTAIVGALSFKQGQKAIIERTEDQLLSIKEIKKTQVETFFEERVGDVKVLSNNPSVVQAFKEFNQAAAIAKENGSEGKLMLDDSTYKAVLERNHQVFSYYMETYGYYDIFLLNPNKGEVIYTVARENDFGTYLSQTNTHLTEVWKESLNSGKPALSDMKAYAPSNGAPAMFVTNPILENGRIIGILAFQISNEAINSIMQQKAGLGESGETYLLGSDYLLRSDSRFSTESTVLKQKVETKTAMSAIAGNMGSEIVPDYRGINVLSVYGQLELPGINWAILAEIDEAEINQPVYALGKIILTIFVLVSLLLVVFAYFIAKSFSKPISDSVKFAQLIARGDLTASLDISQKDEIGLLADALKNMVEKLKEVVSNVVNGAENISSASEQMSSSTQQMSQGATEQASSTEEVSSSIEEMAANIQQNTDNAQQTEAISLKAAEGMNKVGSAARDSLASVKEIAEKISIVNDIAFQTNILALNAAVEAARAGEHGKGFAVVAAEVRKLAERSKVAADEIQILSKSSLEATEDSANLMDELIPEIEKTAKLVQEISAASLEQNSGTTQINNAIQQLNQVTQQNAAASEEMATSSEELAGQADSLKELVSFFKVDSSLKSMKSKIVKKTTNITRPIAEENKVLEGNSQEVEKGINLNLADSKDTTDFEKY